MEKFGRWSLLGILLFIFVLTGCGGITATTTTTTSHVDMSDMQGGGGATPAAGSTMTDPMTDSLKNLSGKDFEVKFMQEMIAHHQAALDMATLVPTHTQRAELNTLSRNIITAQSQEIKDMTGWLNQWYHEKPLEDPMQAPGMMDMMGDMDKLKTLKNADFDKQFTTMMIRHHQQAVNMAQLIPQKTQRPELVKLGQNIIKTQSAEIQQMQSWQKAWFKS